MILQTNSVRQQRAENIARLKAFYGPRYRQLNGAKFRAEFFAEDGIKQMAFPVVSTEKMGPEFPARKLLSEQPDYAAGMDLACIINPTEDPNVFWVEAMESGMLTLMGVTAPYQGRSLNLFRFNDQGEISLWREYASFYPIRHFLNHVGPEYQWRPGHGEAPPDGGDIPPDGGDPPPMVSLSPEQEQKWETELHPHLALKDTPVETESGVKTQIAVMDFSDYSLEADVTRAQNAFTACTHFGPPSRLAEGMANSTKLFSDTGMGCFEFSHEEQGGDAWFRVPEGNKSNNIIPFYPTWFMRVKQVYLTPDPHRVWVEKCLVPVREDNYLEIDEQAYFNHYVFQFVFNDAGEIMLMREFTDNENEDICNGNPPPALPPEALAFYYGM